MRHCDVESVSCSATLDGRAYAEIRCSCGELVSALNMVEAVEEYGHHRETRGRGNALATAVEHEGRHYS